MAAVSVRRIPVHAEGIVGVVFEPAGGSDQFAVMLGGSYGGVPEAPARRLAQQGVCAFALGYFGAPGLPAALIEIPIEALQRGIDWFSDGYAGGRPVGLMGFSKGAELALVLGARLGSSVRRVVAVAPSNVVWFGLKASETRSRSPVIEVKLEPRRRATALPGEPTRRHARDR